MLVCSIVSLFPESIRPYFESSILKRAQEKIRPHGSKPGRNAVLKINYIDPKTFVPKGERIDRRPYGGGPGMVIEPECMLRAIEKAKAKVKNTKPKIVFFATDGVQFTKNLPKNGLSKSILFLLQDVMRVSTLVWRVS